MSPLDVPGDPLVSGLAALADALRADIPLARDRESHIRATARASAASALLETALETATIRSRPLQDGMTGN